MIALPTPHFKDSSQRDFVLCHQRDQQRVRLLKCPRCLARHVIEVVKRLCIRMHVLPRYVTSTCELGASFYVVQTLLAWAQVYGNNVVRERCGETNACDTVVQREIDCT